VAPERSAPSSPGRDPLRLWGPVVAYCLLIFALSSISAVPALPAHVTDKMAHVALYSGLGFLAARALAGGLGRPLPPFVVLAVLVFAGLYGLSDEVHQLFVPNRQFDLRDLAADVIGGGLGAGAFWLWGILRRIRDAV
jgi:VanZ family protein